MQRTDRGFLQADGEDRCVVTVAGIAHISWQKMVFFWCRFLSDFGNETRYSQLLDTTTCTPVQ
jgi:hypothetical protein